MVKVERSFYACYQFADGSRVLLGDDVMASTPETESADFMWRVSGRGTPTTRDKEIIRALRSARDVHFRAMPVHERREL